MEWITIMTFNNMSEVVAIRGRLEAEGITCYVKDELINQVHSFYGAAGGGVKLQVLETEVDQAVAVLKEYGFWKEEPTGIHPYVRKIDELTCKIPLLGKQPLRIRFFTLLTFAALALGGTAAFYFTPTPQENLTATWCLDGFTYIGKRYNPGTMNLLTGEAEDCPISLTFYREGTVWLPGFNSGEVNGYWKLAGDSLTIWGVDTFGFDYNAAYSVEASGHKLVLQSATTRMECHRSTTGFTR